MSRPEATLVAKRVRAVRLSAPERMQKTTPKELRARMMEGVEQR